MNGPISIVKREHGLKRKSVLNKFTHMGVQCGVSLALLSCLAAPTMAATQQQDAHYSRLVEFLSIPNFSANVTDIDANIAWLTRNFQPLGFRTQTLKNKGNDLFFAHRHVSDDLPTVLFYMHFDGQPVDLSKWTQSNPYQPVLKYRKDELNEQTLRWQDVRNKDFAEEDIRVYARSASDDKGPIAMFLSALTDLKAQGQQPAFNIKVILDSMEEVGSPYLESAVKQYKNELQSDYFVVFDGPMHDSGNPTLLYGVRGISTVTLEVYGMQKPQHSGHFGNYGPNPVFRAAEILNSLKDRDGKVLVKGYYDGIHITDDVKRVLASVPDDANKLRHRAGFATPEKVGATYQEALQYPSLNVRGIRSAWVGDEVRTVVPDKTIIEIDMRTVPESTPTELEAKLRKHIEQLGYTLLDKPATPQDLLTISKPVFFEAKHEMFSFRTNIDSEIGDWLRKSVQRNGQKTVQIRITGGSVPLSFFINALDVPTVLVPVVNADNNQHSPNENLKLSYYFDGIETIKQIMVTGIN